MLHHDAVAGHAVVVVRVDDGEGLVDQLLGGQKRLNGAQRFGALGGNGAALGQIGQFLIGVLHVNLLGDQIADLRLELRFKAVLDDENDLGEAGLDRVVNGVEHQRFVVGTHAVDLLVAAVTGTHTGSHDNQRLIHPCFPP